MREPDKKAWYQSVHGGTLVASPIMQQRGQILRLNPTESERLLRKALWWRITDNPFRVLFNRSFSHFIPDFYFPEAKLIVECDGSQHQTTEGMAYDERRDTYFLAKYGIVTMRFANRAIQENTEEIVDLIIAKVRARAKQFDSAGKKAKSQSIGKGAGLTLRGDMLPVDQRRSPRPPVPSEPGQSGIGL